MTPLSFILATIAISIFLHSLLGYLAQPVPTHSCPAQSHGPSSGTYPISTPCPHHSIVALAQAYGPVLRLQLGLVDVVVAASGSVVAQLLKTHDAKLLEPAAPFCIEASWVQLPRKISSVHLFSSKALDDHRHEEDGILTHALAHVGSASANLSQLLNVCTANALGRVMLGKRVFRDRKGGADPKADEFKSMVVEAMVLAGVFNISNSVLAIVAAKMKTLHRHFDAFLMAIVEEHQANMGNRGNKHNDFLSTLISLQDIADEEGRKLTDTEIKALLQVQSLSLK